MKLFFTLMSIDVIVSLFYSIINGFSSFSFINCLFTIGMIYFLFGGLCFIWEKGFFNITLFSFNKINQNIQKHKGGLSDEPKITLDEYLYRSNYFYLTNSLLLCGGLISFVSILVSLMYV